MAQFSMLPPPLRTTWDSIRFVLVCIYIVLVKGTAAQMVYAFQKWSYDIFYSRKNKQSMFCSVQCTHFFSV